MPNLTFVLPHWLYWLGLIAVPLLAMAVLHTRGGQTGPPRTLRSIAYFLWFTGGFVGLHRFYLRSWWGLIYLPLFLVLLWGNIAMRDARNEVSKASNEVSSTAFLIERAEKNVERGRRGAEAKLSAARDAHADALAAQRRSEAVATTAHSRVRWTAIAILALLLFDAVRIVPLVRRCQANDKAVQPAVCDPCLEIAADVPSHHVEHIANPATRLIDRINQFSGNFVAYWSVIAVFVYYYEVVARYVFNSPTNWAHESMFLMFGMQYLLAGGFVLAQDGHVRVDVFYVRFSDRVKSMVDVATSVFFFIFAIALVWTGWIFFSDAFAVREVSFTEWGIQYWPVKLAIPLGALLLLLQGAARLYKDVAFLLHGDTR